MKNKDKIDRATRKEMKEFLAAIHAAGDRASVELEKQQRELEKDPQYIRDHTELVDICDEIIVLRLLPKFHGKLITRADAQMYWHTNMGRIVLRCAKVIIKNGWTLEEYLEQLDTYPKK